jgi:microcystin degradation protein MlrC
MRIGLIHISQETNDFNPEPTTLADFEAFGMFEGETIVEKVGRNGQIGGHFAAIDEIGGGVETVPLIRAFAVAGGRIDAAARRYFLDRIEQGLKQAGRLDGLHLQLHGACAAEGLDDVEGEQAELCRRLLGPDVPILLGLDHHGNATRRMVENVDAIVAHRTQPHDPFDTGLIGMRLLARMVREKLKPVMALRKVPLVTHQEQFLTRTGPMKRWFDAARAHEANPSVLQVSPFPMQPWLDVDEGGWSIVVVTDGDRALADRVADEMAGLCWSMRDEFLVRESIGIDDAIRLADAEPKGCVVLSDTGDTVFGGAAGDSNLILEALLRLKPRGPALVPLISVPAVRRLKEAGVGAEVTLPLGGHVATEFFKPLPVTGRVRSIADGRIAVSDNHQDFVDMGTTVIFDAGPAVLMISEKRGVAGNVPDAWRAFGVEPAQARMAVLKTASNFQYFAPITSRVVRADTRGPGQSDVKGLPWRRLPRPIYPLDPMTDWRQTRAAPAKR